MNNFLTTLTGWFGFGRNATSDSVGKQNPLPSTALVEDVRNVGVDGALQISAVWACVSLLAKTIASLPLMVYETKNGQRTLARESSLWQLLHESPNARMTPMEFWVAMLLNLLLRGNAYARIERSANGEAYALWPMSADQVEMAVLTDGTVVYKYTLGANVAILSSDNVLHLKEMGNGTIGLARLDYMRATAAEAANAQTAANKLFANGGKPTGVLMVDNVLSPEQRKAIKDGFSDMASGSTSRLYVLEANMKYQQINLTPEDMQLLETRQFGVQEIGRWFGVPSILINQTEGTTTLGSSSGEIIESFYKTTIRPGLVSLEQSMRKRIMTSGQRARYTIEFSLDGLLRANLEKRMEIYAKAVQNGIKTRNECRQLENDPPINGGDLLTAQSNLVPVELLGKVKGTGNVTENPVAQ